MKRSFNLILILLLLASGSVMPEDNNLAVVPGGNYLFGQAFISPVRALNGQEDLNQKSPNLQETQPSNSKILELKPDLPKLDKHKPEHRLEPEHKLESKSEPSKLNRVPLKGSVQHQEIIKGKQLGNGTSVEGNGQFEGGTRAGKLDGNAQKGGLRGKLSHGGGDEMGLGIIGVKFVMAFGRTPVIYEVFPGTPAAEVGMRPRDIIVAVDGIPTMGLTKDEVYNMIVGQPNTSVTISFKRKNDFQVKQITRMDLNKVADPFLRRDYLRM